MSELEAIDTRVQATALPREGPGAALLVWSLEGGGGQSGGGAGETLARRIWLGGGPRLVHGRVLEGAGILSWLEQAATAAERAPTVEAFAALPRLAHELIRRGSVRPEVHGQLAVPRFTWAAAPDATERALLAGLLRAMPPAGLAPLADGPTPPDDGWRRLRGILDACVDALVRRTPGQPLLGTGSFEAEIETALCGPSDALPRLGPGPRVRRVLDQWEQAARAAVRPKVKLVLQLDPPEEGGPFRLTFLAESRELGTRGLLRARDVFLGTADGHLLADDLGPSRALLTEALHRAGQKVLPVEVSLASGVPDGAALTAEEAWALTTRHRAELEAQGVRVLVAPALEGLEGRFPRARVRLLRDDGASPAEASLAQRYLARWEVASGERVLGPEELRVAAKGAPLAQVGGTWIPMTGEAGERLAKVAERPEAGWTGPQALAAALAGEVRQPGDLADAQVVAEPGLTALIAELARDAEEVAQPEALKATLRNYQRRGLSWLFHRTRLGLGALLADDMGLGKTVQLISLLLLLKERGADGGPTLLACPASLVGNWERELARFAPGLKVVRHHGDTRRRDAGELQATAGPHDVVLTTYGLVRRDAAMLSQVRWGTLVCDEAQNVKNPQAAQAKAIRLLPARRRIALSGTPVENRLTELWALMEYLNPGLLGPLDRFRREFALPIEKDRDARAVRWLQAATRPFLLRRLKTDPDIAPELPEKEIIRVFCSLSEEQAKLYKEAVDESLAAIDGAEGIERQGRVLKLLTRLKQICNHPAQVSGEGPLAGRSGKLERAAEMLEEIAESGERALVFTQYVQMGQLLVRHFGERIGAEVPLFHGGLSLEERDRMVRRFQEAPDGPPVLVLSLKAGGVGLNLTRASHVVHYDRWWNPAVEDQATDRAHRIGQTKRVSVHHLVSMGTLEEKIDRMLEEKRQLADAVIQGGEAWLAKLSTDELRALVSLGSDAAVESIESWDESRG